MTTVVGRQDRGGERADGPELVGRSRQESAGLLQWPRHERLGSVAMSPSDR
jgi:hypothetical protein